MFPGGMRPLPTTSARVTQHDAQIRAAARPLKATAPTRRWTSTCQVDRQTVYGPSTSSSTAAIGALSRRMTTPSWLTLIAAAGGIAAIIDYSLIPKARMATLVAQVRLAASWLQAQARSFGGDPQGLTASGHFVGAHLASFLACRAAHEPEVMLPALNSVLLVSGIYDLEPISRCFLQPELQLTPDEVACWTPIRATPDRRRRIYLLVGALENAPFHEQARAFEAHLRHTGVRTRLATVPDEDHMTIVRALGRLGTACATISRRPSEHRPRPDHDAAYLPPQRCG